MLTDGTGYELGQGKISLDVPDAPLWLVHLGGGFPLGYDDPTLQAVQASGGGAASTVEEALARYAIGKGAPGLADEVDGYVWVTLPTGEVSAQAGDILASTASGSEDEGFTALAARRLILAEMAMNQVNSINCLSSTKFTIWRSNKALSPPIPPCWCWSTRSRKTSWKN